MPAADASLIKLNLIGGSAGPLRLKELFTLHNELTSCVISQIKDSLTGSVKIPPRMDGTFVDERESGKY